MDLSNINTLLLDLDGTLINSEKAFFLSFKKVLKTYYKVDICMEDYKKYELEQNAMLLNVLRSNGLINDSDQNIMNYIYEDYEKEFKKVIYEKESLDNFAMLIELKKIKFILGLVTTCRRYYLDILLKSLKIEDLFDCIVAREDVERLKPFPDAYLKTIGDLRLDRNMCLAVEDSKRGIDASIDAGIKTVQVSNFTSIKYIDKRAIQYDSANILLKKLIEGK